MIAGWNRAGSLSIRVQQQLCFIGRPAIMKA